MDKKEENIASLLKRALSNQVELGYGQAIVDLDSLTTHQKEIDVAEALDLKEEQAAISQNIIYPNFSSLEEHSSAICNCTKCPLGKTRNKFVYGIGNPNADVMFIGEAPGAREDELGVPFVGRAGELLDKILAAIQFSRDNVFIANILKCRPPNNRDPLPEEMEQCFPYLTEQIRQIKPKIICALGRISAQGLLRTSTPLGKLRGQWHEFEGVPMMVTYHPAALLRFSSYKRDTWTDMKMLRAKYETF